LAALAAADSQTSQAMLAQNLQEDAALAAARVENAAPVADTDAWAGTG